ncbi:hypothetical protein CLIB1444_01S05996 [[Candida] jaroonii]|uniref:Uncharacterized protein n=1 Tax=[Candida] jaroonii TaxID=467808 RepID=A0ACA9Y1G0_9ASCO|nr:hypothetical protein CLIB1444_01S05996 [[Candida] jaroonii]
MEEIPSEQTTLSDNNILNYISPYFQVSETKYGGNGCFSYNTIPKGEIILISKIPVGSTVSRDFKKEVCNLCFKYDDGRNLKHKLGLPKYNQYLYFCSETCVNTFNEIDPEKLLTKSLLDLDNYYNQGLKKPEVEYSSKPLTESNIENKWQETEIWDNDILKIKSTKWSKFIPRINESEYSEIKYIISILFQMFQSENAEANTEFMKDLNIRESLNFEVKLFDFLQNSETEKYLKFPELLESYVNIFKFVRLTSPIQFQKFINTSTIRSIIGKNLTNAFGIWSITGDSEVDHNINENREFFGFGVFPSASFFNHSCDPNIKKIRKGNELHFQTKREIEPHEELCIDYGNYLDESVEIRRKQLKEWFFDCGCKRCEVELKSG